MSNDLGWRDLADRRYTCLTQIRKGTYITILSGKQYFSGLLCM